MAQHAYERSLQEFAKSVSRPLDSATRSHLRELCADLHPREVDASTTERVVEIIKDL